MAYPLGVTFHRAFDRVADQAQALEDVIATGCERILTSGLQPTALQGAGNIAALIRQAANRIIIMPGSGVRSDTINELAKQTGAVEFHTSARINLASSMDYTNEMMKETLQSVSVDADEVKNIALALSQL